MAQRQRLTIAERVRVLTARMTMAEAAKAIGVSVRTLRRWKNEGKEPSNPDTRRALVEKSARERSRILRAGRTGADRYEVPNIPVPPLTQRVRWKDRDDPRRKRTIRSDTISHDIRRMDLSDVLKLIRYYADRGAMIRIIYRVPKGGTSLGGREYLRSANASTTWIVLSQKSSDDQLLSLIYDLHPDGVSSQGRRLISLMVLSDGGGLVTKKRRDEIVRKRDAEKRKSAQAQKRSAARNANKANREKARKTGGTKARPKRRK